MFEGIIESLNAFWRKKECLIIRSHDLEKGAATLGPMTFFKALDDEPCQVAYVDPCRRPVDSCFAQGSTERYQRFFQYQVLLKPAPDKNRAEELFSQSLKAIDDSLMRTDLEFRPDSWTSPVFGAEGSGWEVWWRGSEIAQITYFRKVGGVECKGKPLEVTYGLERVAAGVEEVDNFGDIEWSNNITYGDIFNESEKEHSQYNTKVASAKRHSNLIDIFLEECEKSVSKKLYNPALDYLLKSAHSYNIAKNSRNSESFEESHYLDKIKKLSNRLARKYKKNS